MTLFSPDERTEVIQGSIESVVFQSSDGFFSVVRLLREPSREEVVAIGDLGTVAPGETLRLSGRFTEHPSHGRRFRVLSFTPVLPSTEDGIVRYLGSGRISGIGKGLAQRLVQRFGERTLDVIATQSARLEEVPGIGRSRARRIAEAVRERRDEAELMSYLHGLGIGPALAKKLRRRYGAEAVKVLREDPYIVAEQVHGVGFRTADRIGRASGIEADDTRRAEAAVLHVVGKLADDGHAYATEAQLTDACSALDVPAERVVPAITALGQMSDRRKYPLVVREDDAVYSSLLFHAERAVAQLLSERIAEREVSAEARAALEASLPESLSETQREAVRRTFASRLLVLTGGPGTGKTTTVRGIVEAHQKLGHRVVLCAPTGRAAKRLSEAAGAAASTIHRLLEWNPATAQFQRDADSPLEADLVLVDESSMLNLRLAHSLFEAVPNQTTLVLVGDVDQLPPVGPGQVLRDVIESGVVPVVRLREIFRQAQASDIVRGAHAILHGEMPQSSPPGSKGAGELFVVRARDADACKARLLEMLRRLPTAYGFDPRREVQVLTPMRRGPLGTDRLNELLQQALNPARDRDRHPSALRSGDKVMQLRNDYEKETFNGDMGEVNLVQGGVTYVRIDGREVRYPVEDLDDLALAYASTVHKVQGSEFAAVIVVLHASHHVLLSRALIYTAITRAKQLVVVVGDERALKRAIDNADPYRCQSRLGDRLRANREDAPHGRRTS